MIKIDVKENSQNTIINMVSSILNVGECEEIIIKTKDDLTKTKIVKSQNIQTILKKIGVPCRLSGYTYIQDGVEILRDDPYKMKTFVKTVYSEIALKNQTTPMRVERSIRHAIERTFDYGDVDEIYKYFGNAYDRKKGKPTNKEFMAVLVELMKQGDLEEYEH